MVNKQTILVIDDEQDLRYLIEYNLEKEGFRVLKAEEGPGGINMIRRHDPDLVLLDIMMPDMSGLEVAKLVREDEKIKHVPIIFLTAREDEETEVRGLDIGGDDYITKPISITKLISRIKAVLRRVDVIEEPQNVIEVHDLKIDKDRYLVTKGAEEYQLPRKEFELLFYLANRKGKVMDRQTILSQIWGTDVYVVDRTVDVHVRKIRKKIGKKYIETVKGVGYRFKE